MIFVYSLLGNLIIGISLIILTFFLSKFKSIIVKYLENITALTVGLLLGIIFLGFIPEIIGEGLSSDSLGLLIILGLMLFYGMELGLHHHHCKDIGDKNAKDIHSHSKLMRLGTLLHNILHGLVLYSAFSVSTEFGISVTIAVLLHSIPQNTANYIMNHHNIKIVLLAAIGGIIGVLLLFPFTQLLLKYQLEILSIISGGLLYIALTDILPQVKDKGQNMDKLIYFVFVLIGVIVIYFI